ncbi:SCO7613 C-terminal domain-containing membrane protein [Streptomyces sp. NPDC002073]
MDNLPPPAEELVLLDRELARLDAHRARLLARRAWLLGVLQPPAAAPFAPWSPPPARAAGRPGQGPGAQHVLLTLGAVLVAIAALAFTVVSWGALGIGGRSVVLAAVTAAALGAPAPLLRRGLGATAEAVAGLGLALTVLDAYALYAVGLRGVDGTAYAAGAAAVLAAGWAGYGWLFRELRLPWPAALFVAQLPLPLAALAADAPPVAVGWALLGTAALDGALALRVSAVLRWFAGSAGAMAGAGALLTALTESWSTGPRTATAVAAEALLLVAGGVAVVAAGRAPRVAVAVSGAGALALVAGLGGLVRPSGAGAWVVVGYLLCAAPLLAVVRVHRAPAPVRRGVLGAAAVTAGLAVLLVLPGLGLSLVARGAVLTEVWRAGTPSVSLVWPGGVIPVVLLLAAAGAGWLGRRLRLPWLVAVAVACGAAGLFVLPTALALPVAAVLAVQVAVVTAVFAAARPGPYPWSAGRRSGWALEACGVLGAAAVSVAALDGRVATFAVFAVLGGACAAGAARPVPAVLAVGYATGLLVALGRLLERDWHVCALLVLLVPAAVAVRPPRVSRVAVEAAAGAAGALAVLLALTAGRPAWLALVLALAGVVCAGAAVRPERRRAGYAAGALLLAATWVRLAASGVAVPEAYTLPVTLPALVVGWLRMRRDPQASSWAAYGPGLAATLLPSLAAAWGDAHWLRPLLLGAAALAVTLAGGRLRLQAPLLLGGAVLVLVALHELAPYVVQVAGVLPRWLPPALAGLLLLAVGATYEKRLRDARRVREALGRLR